MWLLLCVVQMGVNREQKEGYSIFTGTARNPTHGACNCLGSSVVQRHGVTPFHRADRVRPFPHKNKLGWGRQTSATVRTKETRKEAHHVRIRSRACGVRKHLVLRHDADLRVIILEPRIGVLRQMARVEKVVAPLRRRATVYEHGRELINGLVLVPPDVLELLLHACYVPAQIVQLVADVIALRAQVGQQLIVELG